MSRAVKCRIEWGAGWILALAQHNPTAEEVQEKDDERSLRLNGASRVNSSAHDLRNGLAGNKTRIHDIYSILYFTSNIGKYEWGVWGGSSARSTFQRLYEVGKLGGSLDSEKTFSACAIVAMAEVSSMGS